MPIDALILDRVAQPVADRLARWWAPWDVADWLCGPAVTVGALLVAAHRATWVSPIIFLGSIFLSWYAHTVADEGRMHGRRRDGTINPNRTKTLSDRYWSLFLLATNAIPPETTSNLLSSAFWAIYAASLYLSSCEHHPPVRRQSISNAAVAGAKA